MFPAKAPGLDGFLALCYQHYWVVVDPNTVSSCLDILHKRMSIREWNSPNIILMLKTKSPVTVGDFRPISLCNVKYKIVTKTIANCLKPIVDEIISIQ